MNLAGKRVCVTGAASGIGAALAGRLASEGIEHLWLVDTNLSGLETVAASCGVSSSCHAIDVTDGAALTESVRAWWGEQGSMDLLFSNAGIATGLGVDAPQSAWHQAFAVNVLGLANWVTAIRAVRSFNEPLHIVVTASAAGLLTNLGDAPYTTTKHAVIGLAEWIAITHGEEGITVQCLCPQGVRTPMVTGGLDAEQLGAEVVAAMGLIEPEECAAATLEALGNGEFLILPHPEVAEYLRRKSADRQRWISGMQRLARRLS